MYGGKYTKMWNIFSYIHTYVWNKHGHPYYYAQKSPFKKSMYLLKTLHILKVHTVEYIIHKQQNNVCRKIEIKPRKLNINPENINIKYIINGNFQKKQKQNKNWNISSLIFFETHRSSTYFQHQFTTLPIVHVGRRQATACLPPQPLARWMSYGRPVLRFFPFFSMFLFYVSFLNFLFYYFIL